MRLLSPLLRLMLVLALLTGAPPMAAASTGVIEVALCSPDGTSVLLLDAQGKPVAAHPPCRFCMLTALAVLPDPPVAFAPVGRGVAIAPHPATVETATADGGTDRARGPPRAA